MVTAFFPVPRRVTCNLDDFVRRPARLMWDCFIRMSDRLESRMEATGPERRSKIPMEPVLREHVPD